MPAVRVTTLRRDWTGERALERITLEIAPWVSREEVAHIYTQAQAQLGPWPAKPLGAQTERLLLFVAQRIGVRAGRPRLRWRDLLAEWNVACLESGHADWCYATSDGTDPNHAWRRLQSDYRRAERSVLPRRV
jgi:hypothetical protein